MSAPTIFKRTLDSKDIKILYYSGLVAISVLWFLPAIIWRYALKSTFWLYGPLAFIAHPGSLATETNRSIWINGERSLWNWIQLILALIFCLPALAAIIDFEALEKIWGEATNVPKILLAPFALNPDALANQIWRAFSLANLIAAIVIFLWRDHLRAQIRSGATIPMFGWPVGWQVALIQAQKMFVLFYWLLGFLYLAYFFEDRLPGWLSAILP